MHIRRISMTKYPYPYPFKQGNYYPYPIRIRENCGYPQNIYPRIHIRASLLLGKVSSWQRVYIRTIRTGIMLQNRFLSSNINSLSKV